MTHECDHDWDDVCPNCDPDREPECSHPEYLLQRVHGADGWNRLVCTCGVTVLSTNGELPRRRTYEERMCDDAQTRWERWRGL